jgi:predicted secreted hydrolase
MEYGTYVEPDGRATHLGADEVEAKATGRWTSPRTGSTYPSGWTLKIPGRRLELTIGPVLVDQELDTGRSTGLSYWEGAVEVAGAHGGKAVRGEGYVELTGYARSRR